VNRLAHFCLGIIYLSFLNIGLHAQTDASIRAAKSTVTDASGAFKPYQKFSDIENVHWLFGGDGALSFRATSLANWAAGGEDQIGISPIVNLFLNYKKDKRTFENYMTLAYGFLKTGERKAVKSDDRLLYTAKLGQQISPKWFYTTSLLARTQFTPGYKYSSTDTIRISDFLAPAYLYVSAGLDYRPNNSFSLVFSPVMGKATYVNSGNMTVLATAGMVTTEKDETGAEIKIPHRSRYEFGGGALLSFKGNLFKDMVSYNSQIELFSNYVQKPENVDVLWTFQAKILLYKNITGDFRLDLKYDDDQKTVKDDGSLGGAKVQLKYFTGIGLFYQF